MEEDIKFAREQQQRQIQSDPNTQIADQIREERAFNILSQLNPDNLLTDLEHRIRREKKMSVTGEWVAISPGAAPVSEEMVSDVISFLGSILNQNTTMSNFKESEVNALMEMISNMVIELFNVNATKYKIEGNYAEYNRIGHLICTTAFTCLKRSLNGSEGRRVFNMVSVNENINPEKKTKFAENFKFW